MHRPTGKNDYERTLQSSELQPIIQRLLVGVSQETRADVKRLARKELIADILDDAVIILSQCNLRSPYLEKNSLPRSIESRMQHLSTSLQKALAGRLQRLQIDAALNEASFSHDQRGVNMKNLWRKMFEAAILSSTISDTAGITEQIKLAISGALEPKTENSPLSPISSSTAAIPEVKSPETIKQIYGFSCHNFDFLAGLRHGATATFERRLVGAFADLKVGDVLDLHRQIGLKTVRVRLLAIDDVSAPSDRRKSEVSSTDQKVFWIEIL